MGEDILALADIWPEAPRAVMVGLDPAPQSVELGHYYLGRFGRRQVLRLAEAGLLKPPAHGTSFEEEAIAAGVWFTDFVKRPIRGEGDLYRTDLAHGRAALMDALRDHQVLLVACVFRDPAKPVMGGRSIVGFQMTPTPWAARCSGCKDPSKRPTRSPRGWRCSTTS